jgi:YfiH family protein
MTASSYIYENEDIVVFFGETSTTRDHLLTNFSQFNFHFIRQVHGTTCIDAQFNPERSEAREADAHFTDASDLALPIQTADCLPVLAWSPSVRQVTAIHAGWRGLVNDIIPKSLQNIAASDLHVWIGPHIHRASFEISLDVAEKIDQNADRHRQDSHQLAKVIFAHDDAEKRYADLTALAHLQLHHLGLNPDHIWTSPINTFVDPNHHSFRREKTSGRQWSWIALKSV